MVRLIMSLNQQDLLNLKKGDILVYTSGTQKSEWTVDYPIPRPDEIDDDFNLFAHFDGLRVSTAQPTGRGISRLSLLVKDFHKWSIKDLSEVSEPVNVESPAEIKSEPQVSSQPTVKVPTLIELIPAVNASGVALDAAVILKFDTPVKVGSGKITFMVDGKKSIVINTESGDVLAQSDINSLFISHSEPFKPNTTYTVVLSENVVEDLEGNPVDAFGNNVYKFTTVVE